MSTALATYAAPRMWQGGELAIIKEQVAKDCSDIELAYFFEVCQQTGLNPMARQIYAIKRGANTKMSIQTGIDGYRLAAARSGCYAGSDDPEYDSEDGAHPTWARVTVWKLVQGQRVPFSAKARWSEYHVKSTNNQNMWDKMPYLMLGKCAEALALRKAFPLELSGTYTKEEMEQADYADIGPAIVAEAPKPTPRRIDKPQSQAANPIDIQLKARQQRIADLCKDNGVTKETLLAYMSEQGLDSKRIPDLDACIAWLTDAPKEAQETATDDSVTF